MATSYSIGHRVSYDGAVCTVRYVGEVKGTPGSWLGVEWDDPGRGKHDGSHKGVQYFKCLSTFPTSASFVRPFRPAESARSFLEAVREKYASEARGDFVPAKEIVISGKVAEEVGFDKIRRQQARLKELKVVILDSLRINTAVSRDDQLYQITETCPDIVELDLSRNLFTNFQVIRDIVAQLKNVRRLKLNGNRFQNILNTPSLEGSESAFQGIKELALDETLLTWEETAHIASKFPDLTTLFASGNQLSYIPKVPIEYGKHMTVLNLEFNEFISLSCLGALATLPLRTLHLKGNKISRLSTTALDTSSDNLEVANTLPTHPPSLHYVDLSYNSIPCWSLIDTLPVIFPGLTALRLSHNPIYERPDPSFAATSAAAPTSTAATDEAHMLTVARLASLTTLNFAALTSQDRSNAEMFYLSRISRQLATVPPEKEGEIVKQNPRYKELCQIYGAPDVVRKTTVSESLLEGRLVNVGFRYNPSKGTGAADRSEEDIPRGPIKKARAKIPKSFDLYAVQGIAGRLFGIPPLKTKLVWETGEWDPVAGYDDRDRDSSEDEALEVAAEKGEDLLESKAEDKFGDEYRTKGKKMGRWVKREVELREGPRMFGFVVDGLQVRIRVEVREK
ncbi:putative tubulin-specific chaperone e protein [Zalerion maritima]|uniref:Tubulin-specific chaperone e protein n=1 Tax=Zalerion maritima TaxID=339359 RepID=A0AAD5WR46_9PEZI|nr:putative tubulin-specific chaperone e protein [Zalerion maritima]